MRWSASESGMPIIIVVLILFFGFGGFGRLQQRLRGEWGAPHACVQTARVARVEAADFQSRCSARFEDARLLLVGKAMLRDEQAGAGSTQVDLWRRVEVRQQSLGGDGIMLTLHGPDGARWSAGVSAAQPE